MNRCPRHTRLISLLVSLAVVACKSPPPPGADFVVAWESVTDTLTASLPADDARRARLRAFASLAMFEGYASDASTGLRSLAGQVNGLWSSARPERGPLDGAIVAAEAQRVLLDSLASHAPAIRAAVDSLARAQLAARRNAGVAADVAERSRRHGTSVGRTLATLAVSEAPRTLVLRHQDECALTPRGGSFAVTAQGGPSAAASSGRDSTALARDQAELLVIETIKQADAIAASRSRIRASQAPSECVEERVRGRLRTRSSTP